MDLAALRDSLREPDFDALSVEELRTYVGVLLEGFVTLFDRQLELELRLKTQEARIRELEAENRRLKGLPDPPDRSSGATGGSRPPRNRNTSSERERKKPRPRRREKASKNGLLEPNETRRVDVDRRTLPADAVPKGYRRVVKQDLLIQVRVVEMLLARYYSPSERKTYQAPAPQGWEGQFGPVIKALILTLGYGQNQSHAPIHELLTALGVKISTGKVCAVLVGLRKDFEAERRAVFQAGLESSPWQQTDMTPTGVNGRPETCQVIGNPTYTHFETGPGHDRSSVVRLLRAGTPDAYLLDEETLELLRAHRWSRKQLERLRPYGEPYLRSREVLRRKIRCVSLLLNEEQQAEFWACALLAGYRGDREVTRVPCLLTDDAALYYGVSRQPALCWIHELRHFKELQPRYAHHARQVERVLRQAWQLYRELEAYRTSPDPSTAAQHRARFDQVFGQEVTFPELQARLQLTRAKKERLLRVLDHPEVPLHNNEMELGARKRVRKRDVSFGPRSREGAKAWDIFQGLSATTTKLGVSFYEYLLDRITGGGKIPPLGELVRGKARELGLGRTWTTSSTAY